MTNLDREKVLELLDSMKQATWHSSDFFRAVGMIRKQIESGELDVDEPEPQKAEY
jgi:hypothetical protein